MGALTTTRARKFWMSWRHFFLRLRKIEVEGGAVIKLRVNNGDGDGTSCFKIKIRTNTTKLTNVRITRFRQCRHLVRQSEMLIKVEAKIASRVVLGEVLCS